MPSACGALTSARCRSSARTAVAVHLLRRVRHRRAVGGRRARLTAATQERSQRQAERRRVVHHGLSPDSSEREQLVDLAMAVGERIEADADFVEQRQMQIGQRRRLLVLDVAAALACLPAPPPATMIGRLTWS